jgi:preprotein translocase subunit YajC
MNVLANTAAKTSGFNPTTLILILLVVVAFYMLMIRPQRRRQQQAQQQRSNVEPGARVRTTAGMYATVVDVDGDDVILEVAPGIEVRYMKRAIMDVVSPADESPADTDEATQTDESDAADEVEVDEVDVVKTPTAEASDTVESTDDTVYEKATGTKQD